MGNRFRTMIKKCTITFVLSFLLDCTSSPKRVGNGCFFEYTEEKYDSRLNLFESKIFAHHRPDPLNYFLYDDYLKISRHTLGYVFLFRREDELLAVDNCKVRKNDLSEPYSKYGIYLFPSWFEILFMSKEDIKKNFKEIHIRRNGVNWTIYTEEL